MVMEYFTKHKRKPSTAVAVADEPKSPLLNDEDEKFLERLTAAAAGAEEQAPPLPDRPVVIFEGDKPVQGKDAQTALMDGADQVALPSSPPAVEGSTAKSSGSKAGKKAADYLTYAKSIPGMLTAKGKAKQTGAAGADLQAAVNAAKKGETVDPSAVKTDESEQAKEASELTSVLDQLNLSAVNNRVFSFSKESQKLMDEFTQILKDIINGVPTAYDDLEKFMKDWDGQLKRMYGNLPPFLQNLVKSLPAKMGGTLAPGLLAAASEKPGFDAKTMGASSAGASKTKMKIPSLKKLVSSQGAATAMLRSILNFLKLRFPAVLTGTNMLMSLAVFLLIFVFWYCHKRGKETRLDRERLSAEDAADSDFDDKSSIELDDSVVLKDESDQLQKILNQPPTASASSETK